MGRRRWEYGEYKKKAEKWKLLKCKNLKRWRCDLKGDRETKAMRVMARLGGVGHGNGKIEIARQ